jgi:dihydrofolate reductase
MRKIIVFTNVTLDGVMQAPGSSDEDPRGGFPFGGWGAGYNAMQSSEIGDSLGNIGPMLFGRRTYDRFYAFWPNQTGSPFTEILNNTPKYVASRTLSEPLPWQNSTLLKGEAALTVADLKDEPGPDLMVMGSGELVRALMRHNLVDRFVLLVHPLVLGCGIKLFPDACQLTRLRLVSAKSTPTGVVVTVYEPAEDHP